MRRMFILHWDGITWSSAFTPGPQVAQNRSLYAVAAISTDDAWAVGDEDVLTRDKWGPYLVPSKTQVLHWDGKVWRAVPSPNPAQMQGFTKVAAVSKDEIWAIGMSGSNGHLGPGLVTRFLRSQCPK